MPTPPRSSRLDDRRAGPFVTGDHNVVVACDSSIDSNRILQQRSPAIDGCRALAGTGPQFAPQPSAPVRCAGDIAAFPADSMRFFTDPMPIRPRVRSSLSIHWAPRSGISRCGRPALLSFSNAIWFARRELPLVRDVGAVPACGEWDDGNRRVRGRDWAPDGVPPALARAPLSSFRASRTGGSRTASKPGWHGTGVAWRAER